MLKYRYCVLTNAILCVYLYQEKQTDMKTLNFNKKEWYRFSHLCSKLGFKVETDATYTYSNLVETEHCYLRIIKHGVAVCIAKLID